MIKTIQSEFLYRKGHKQANAGNWAESIDYFDRVLSLKPNDFGACLHKAISLSKQNKFSEALSIIGETISLKPENHANYLYRGIIYYDSGEYDNALNDFEKSLNLSPENPLLKCYIALTLLRKNEKVKEAYESLLNDIQNTNPEFKARFMVFCESFLLQHTKKAMSLDDSNFHEKYQTNAESKSMFFDILFYRLNRVHTYLSSMFNINKRNHYLHYLDAEQRLNEGDILNAIEGYKKALSYMYEYNETFDRLLTIYFYQKDYESIMKCITKLEEYNKVSKLLFDKSKIQNIKDDLISELKKHVPLVNALGHYYHQIGEYKKAINIFEIAVLNFSDDFYFNYHLGLSYLGADDQQNALSYFHKAFQKLNPNVAKRRLEEMIRISTDL